MDYAADITTEELPISDQNTVDERELNVLSHLRENVVTDAEADREARVSQRSIAEALGMSVGLTNAILKRLTGKGLVMARRINHNNVHYLVTPSGIEQLGRRSYLYLRRTIGNVVRYKERIRAFCHHQKQRGIEEIVLVGESDLTFILEWCADKEGLAFRVMAASRRERGEGQGIRQAEEDGHVEPSRPGKPMGSEIGAQTDRLCGVGSPPAHAGVVFLLSELNPELASREGRAPSGAIPLHEIVLGKR